MSETLQCDVLIIGAGIVGLTFAAALSQTNLKIIILEQQKLKQEALSEDYHVRVSAIARAQENIFKKLNIWSDIQNQRLSTFEKMHVWFDEARNAIDYSAKDLGEDHLGCIIENVVLQNNLLKYIKRHPNIQIIEDVKLKNYLPNENHVEILDEKNQKIHAKLIVGADGANSWLRQKAFIPCIKKSYEHSAIIANIKISKPHNKTACQRFFNNEILAFLPLQDEHLCSIVWSCPPKRAEFLMSLSEEQFNQELEFFYESYLGETLLQSQRYCFPLHRQHAKDYVVHRLALIGDAAHTIHPLAGQGLNCGILDAVTLAEEIVVAVKNKKDFSSKQILNNYARIRKNDNSIMMFTMDIFKNALNNDFLAIKTIRNLGLRITDNLPFVKNSLMEYAMGFRGNVPAMAREIKTVE